MPSLITKKVITKKLAGVVYQMYPKSSADIIEFLASDGITVTNLQSVVSDLVSKVGTFGGTASTVSEEVTRQVNAAVATIMGTEDQDSINQALNSIKELADILGDTENEQHTIVEGLITTVGRLKTEVETATTGLLDRTTNLEKKVDGYDTEEDDGEGGTTTVHHDGLMTRVAALETFNAGASTDDIPVGPNLDRNYVTTAQITKITNSAIVQSVAANYAEADMNEQDLYFVDVAAAAAEPSEPSEP